MPRRIAWLHPDVEDNDLRRYATTLRERWRLIAIAVVLALIAAAVYVKTATPVYTATAQLLVSPVSGTDTSTLSGLGVIASSSDPTQDVETGATVVPSLDAAVIAGRLAGISGSPQSILGRISVQPVSQSNILALTATASSADQAAALANDFAQGALLVRTSQFRALLDQKISSLRAQIAVNRNSPTVAPLQQEVASLQAFRAGPLPDMSLASSAVPPSGRSSPRVTLSLAVAIVAGLVLGILGAFGLEAFDQTLRREEQLRRLFRLPVLAKVPLERGSRRAAPRVPDSLSPIAREGYRTLRAMLLASMAGRSILVTSSSSREGKTTTAINLAASLAAAGSSTILIEADIRLPAIGPALGIEPRYGLTDVLTGRVDVSDALVNAPHLPPNLRVLVAHGRSMSSATSGDALFSPTVFALLDDVLGMADHVVIDSPPLVAVIDALDLAVHADAVLLVARLGTTHLGRLARLGELLERADVEPVGMVLIGAQTPGGARQEDYYHYAAQVTDRIAKVPSRSDRAR